MQNHVFSIIYINKLYLNKLCKTISNKKKKTDNIPKTRIKLNKNRNTKNLVSFVAMILYKDMFKYNMKDEYHELKRLISVIIICNTISISDRRICLQMARKIMQFRSTEPVARVACSL